MANNFTVNKHQGVKVDSQCRECRRITKHEVVTEATLKGTYGPVGFGIDWVIEYQIVRCLGCETLSFRRAEGSDQDFVQIGEDEWEYQPRVDIYPSPTDGRQPLSDSELLPEKIQRIYQETLKALNDKQPVLCGIGVRAIVETICKNKEAPGGDLFHKVNGLVSLGVLTQDGADILHKVRTLGNEAAHEAKPHSLEELGLAFDVVDHLLLGVYILPEHAKRTFK
ncbi:DUF4145 domain-containing protein [Stenotrophomonas sp. TD3]|uniref:DUF4145 domain-containing protein n=1 Tax=Stenotrophomonas sp. TD3 TaxID=1641707 RepID=UPI0009515CC2|nr:DUF4145 domain-containing protein [Stenotrophomonas sp. TD3]